MSCFCIKMSYEMTRIYGITRLLVRNRPHKLIDGLFCRGESTDGNKESDERDKKGEETSDDKSKTDEVESISCRGESISGGGGSSPSGESSGGDESTPRDPRAVDFVQQLFLDKIREYARKQQENGGQRFDPIPELEEERERLLTVLNQSYFKTPHPPEDLSAFPTFTFKDSPLDPIDAVENPKK